MRRGTIAIGVVEIVGGGGVEQPPVGRRRHPLRIDNDPIGLGQAGRIDRVQASNGDCGAVLGDWPLGGAGKKVEADATFIGQKRPKASGARGYAHRHAVVSLIERGGKVRSTHVNDVNA